MKKSIFKGKIFRGIVIGVLSFLTALLLYELQFFRQLEWKSWDLRLRQLSDASAVEENIVIFLIDQYSLNVYEKQQGLSWPWPREIYSYIVRYLKSGGAQAVFFDLMFSETSGYGVEDDLMFASSIKEAGNIFLPVFLSEKEDETEESSERISKMHSGIESGEKMNPVYQMKSATFPEENLWAASKGIGNVRFSPDGDGIFRRIPLLFSYNGMIIPAVPLALAQFVKGSQVAIKEREELWFEGRGIPLDDSGQMVIKYSGPQGAYPTYSIASIINSWAQMNEGIKPQIPPHKFDGKIVLVGSSAPGIYDLRPTPFSSVYPGVEIQASVLDNILSKNYISFPSKAATFAFILFFALFTGIGVILLKRPWIIGFFFFICLLLPALVSVLFFFSGYWLEFIAPEFTVLLAFISAALLNYSLEGRQRRFIKNVFQFYLSPSLIEMIVNDPKILKLGGDQRVITSFFTDIRGFTSISEGLSPEELVDLLNLYLSEMSDIILSYQGTLDKYEGDAIIAFWNAPLEQEDHAYKACRAALECQNRLKEMRDYFKSKYGHELFMRIGVNTGPAVVGNMGSRRRFDYTAIGDTVNLASRLEGACKQYKISILVGEDTFHRIRDRILAREVDVIRVVGKSRPVKVFEIIAEREEADDFQIKLASDFQKALEEYKKREWKKAGVLFQKIEGDDLAQLYGERCLEYEKNPPPLDWNGVFDLKIK